MKQNILPTLFALMLCATGACASMASFQTADTVKKGEMRSGLGVTYNKYTVTSEGSEDIDVGVPALHGWTRYGVSDKLELHTMVWIPLGATVGAKYQLLGSDGSNGLSLSTGLDVGYISIKSGEGDDEVESTIYDTHLPLYVGYRLSPGFTTYFVPRYMFRAAVGDTTETSHLAGSALGIALGENSRFHIEAVGLRDFTYDYNIITTGIGFSF